MKRRVFGLETEYALSIETADRRLTAPDPGILFEHMERVLKAGYATLPSDSFGRGTERGQARIEIKEGSFLECGARFYYDTGHLEWATPEAATAVDAARWEVAGETVLSELAQAVVVPRGGRLMLIKNNIDYHSGSTYGCHENYQIERRGSGADDEAYFERLVAALTPFLVTRQVFCGAGKVGSLDHQAGVGFQISQRADYIAHITSVGTRSERAIVNLRDESLADARRFRRLHLILGDSNRIASANRLKLGTTGLLLDLIEAGKLAEPPQLADPVAAIKQVSRDPSCRLELPLTNGRSASAIEIQRWYLDQAERGHLQEKDDHGVAQRLIDDWRRVLDDLARDPDLVADRVDWAAKHRWLLQPQLDRVGTDWEEVQHWSEVFERLKADNAGALPAAPSSAEMTKKQFLLNRQGLDWSDYEDQRRVHYGLRERDLRYHDIHPSRGLFALLSAKGLIESGLDADDIAHATRHPPPDTRAVLRAKVIRWAHAGGIADRVALDWGQVRLSDGPPVMLPDPLATSSPALQRRLQAPTAPSSVESVPARAAVGSIGDEIRLLGVERRPWWKRLFSGSRG